MSSSKPHESVLVKEVLSGFADISLNVFYDGTLGAAGHAKQLLQAHPEIKQYIGCDKDPEALDIARKVLAPWKEKVTFIQGNFADLDLHLKQQQIKQVDGFFLT